MIENRSIVGRHIGLFLLGCFLFSYPVLTLFNLDVRLWGIPMFFLYIFTAWLILILFIMVSGKIPDLFEFPETDSDKNESETP